MPEYTVTYCVQDRSLGTNPLRHAFIMLSKVPDDSRLMEVEKVVGFYPAPMAEPNSWWGWIKSWATIKYDLHENHGELREEELRFLDKGHGLHGKTFHVSKEQYLLAQKRIADTLRMQKEAIEEAKKVNPNFNHKEIFRYEQQEACGLRQPRLKPFDFQFTSMKNSHTCNTESFDILRYIGIPEEELEKLKTIDTLSPLPVFGPKLENIYLFSTGPTREHPSTKSKKIHLYRTFKDPETRLFWAMPPQLVVSQSPEFIKKLSMPKEYVEPVKNIIRRLQQVRNAIAEIRATGDDKKQADILLQKISDITDIFALLGPKNLQLIEEKLQAGRKLLRDIIIADNPEWKEHDKPETEDIYLPDTVDDIYAILEQQQDENRLKISINSP